MVCDRRDKNRTAGYELCTSCWEPLDSCADCERALEEGFSFCPTCSRPLIKSRKSLDTLNMFSVYIAPMVAVLLIIELIVMFAGVPDTWTAAKELSMSVLVLKPELAVAWEISGTVPSVFWIVLVLCITVSVIWLLFQTISSLRKKEV